MTPEQESTIFHEGIRLFNGGRYFDAHEVWEDIWHMASGDRKIFYQGLIQYAVTLEHIRRGNPRGMRNVLQTCKAKFDTLPPVYMGIAVSDMITQLQTFVRPILEMPPKAFDPATGRGQTMPVDLQNAPNITLQYDPFTKDK